MKVAGDAVPAVSVAEHAADIDRLLAGFDRPGHPAIALAVIHRGEVAYLSCRGLADVENGLPAASETVFRIGSVTKQMTATCILILEARGKLRLDDPIGGYVEDLPPWGAVVTLRHLLSMTSGLPDGLSLTNFGGLSEMFAAFPLDRVQHLALLRRLDVAPRAPGEEVLYSNSNYLLLTLVVEAVSGESLAAFMRRELFIPSGMASASLGPGRGAVVSNCARGYAPTADGPAPAMMLYETTGDGGVDASILDMVSWFQAYRSNRLLNGTLREHVEQPVYLNDGQLVDYRAGMTVGVCRGRSRISHTGVAIGFLADLSFFPELDLGVVMLSNWMSMPLLEIGERVLEILCDGQLPKPSVAAELKPGLYMAPERGLALEIQHLEASTVCWMMGDRSAIERTSADVLAPTKRGQHYRLRGLPGTNDLEVVFGAVPPVIFQHCSAPTTQSDLTEYRGDYRSSLLREKHRVDVEGAGLSITLDATLRRLPWSRLAHREGDFFTADVSGQPSASMLGVRFVRDASGRVCGLVYNAYRARDVMFDRIDGGA